MVPLAPSLVVSGNVWRVLFLNSPENSKRSTGSPASPAQKEARHHSSFAMPVIFPDHEVDEFRLRAVILSLGRVNPVTGIADQRHERDRRGGARPGIGRPSGTRLDTGPVLERRARRPRAFGNTLPCRRFVPGPWPVSLVPARTRDSAQAPSPAPAPSLQSPDPPAPQLFRARQSPH